MTKDQQEDFNLIIGLDNCLSKMIIYAVEWDLGGANVQTLKHHAEDMIGAGNKILEVFKAKGLIKE